MIKRLLVCRAESDDDRLAQRVPEAIQAKVLSMDEARRIAAPYIGSYLDAFKAVAASFAVEATAAPVRDRSELKTAIAVQAREPLRVYGRVDSAPTLERVRLLCATLVFGSEGSATEPFGSWWRGT